MVGRPQRSARSPRVDVVVPVHGNRLLALRTIDSVLAARTAMPFELVVIDDESPDPALRADLALLAQRGLISLLANDRNLGFVQSANRGMGLHPDRDVVLLNSDTYVFDGWLDRLFEALDAKPRTATASPLSNAATILSYPVTLRDNAIAPDSDFAAWHGLCAQLGQPPIEVPTAVGFCMAVRRACLDEIGPFDAERFGRGYGEENDFCLRAAAAGWRHVAATRVMVWHRGGGSFGGEKEALVAAGLTIVEQRHPGYLEKVHRFIRADPLRPVREAIDVARVATDPRRKVLRVAIQGVGGAVRRDGPVVLYLVPEIGPYAGQYRLLAPGLGALPNLPRLVCQPGQVTEGFLGRLGIERVEGIGSAPSDELGRHLAKAATQRGIAWQ
jgi:GT2 family glycosyltransferase